MEGIYLPSFLVFRNSSMTKTKKIFFSSSFLVGSFIPLLAFDVNASHSLDLKINDATVESLSPSDISQFIEINPFLLPKNSYNSEIEKLEYCSNTTEPCPLTFTVREKYSTKNYLHTKINRENLQSYLEDAARKIDTDPTDAKLRFNNETNQLEEIEPHTNGIKLEIKKNVDQLENIFTENINNLPGAVELYYEKNPAQITKKNAQKLGIRELIGEGVSDFSGSTKSRIHNITTAAKRFDGLVIPPDEEFSFVSVLGPVDGEHGYKEELVIRDNETKPEYGGGICQVSTTVFRGAIFSGMKITQRRNHSYPVHYYTPTGFDATVYVPAPDFRFINNTPGHILLNMEMEGTELKFRYYGTNDGRAVEMDGPHVTERQPNGAMKTYFVQKVTDKSGEVFINDVFQSNYKSPDDYPHPGDVAKLTTKPDNWSKSEWKRYKKEHGL